MSKRFPSCVALVLSLALTGSLAGCQQPATPAPANTSPSKSGIKAAPKVDIAGTAMAPAGLVAAGGGNLVAAGGGNLVAAGGGNYQLAQAEGLAQSALAGSLVQLVDGDKKVIMETQTDANGRFSFGKVPGNQNYNVKVKVKQGEKDAFLTSLVNAGESDVAADVDTGTTMLGASLAAEGAWKGLVLDALGFKNFSKLIVQAMSSGDLPDFSNPGAVANRCNELAEKNKTLGVELGALFQNAGAKLPEKLNKFKDDIAARAKELKAKFEEAQKKLDEAKDKLSAAGDKVQDALNKLSGK